MQQLHSVTLGFLLTGMNHIQNWEIQIKIFYYFSRHSDYPVINSLSDNGSSPHRREGRVSRAQRDMHRVAVNRAVFDKLKRVLFYTTIEKF